MGYSKRQGASYEGRRGHSKGFKRYPVKVGEELGLDIVECSPKGEGIVRVESLVIHVANGRLGEHLKIKINRIGGTTAEAEAIRD
jgi:predicted RNA-binding protein with TRAM domain